MRSLFVAIGMMALLQGCSIREPLPADQHPPTLTPRTSTYQDLLALPVRKARWWLRCTVFATRPGSTNRPLPAPSPPR